MKTFQILTIKAIVLLNFFYPVNSSPNFLSEYNSHTNHNNIIINNPIKDRTIIYKKNLKVLTTLDKNIYNKTSLSSSYDQEILNKITFKKKLNDSLKDKFKDLSSTYVSPFGKPINRAPDESLINCQSKECYEW